MSSVTKQRPELRGPSSHGSARLRRANLGVQQPQPTMSLRKKYSLKISKETEGGSVFDSGVPAFAEDNVGFSSRSRCMCCSI